MKKYDHKKIEKKWQKEWENSKLYKTTETKNKPKSYVLDMFPYPSGEGLHVGHPKGYIATDIYSRYKKMTGHNILHPMGWDAFGLPAEQYAIKNKVHPKKAVAKNIKRYKKQLSLMGFNYDWSREIDTTDPKYYKWTQWIFLQMYKKGLAYQSNEPINWCPSCKTGLANEDLEGSVCERCGTQVEKKPIRQWVLKITDYADRLLNDLSELDWPESIKEAQRNWIGRSEGAEIEFDIEKSDKKIKVFTTRPDTLFGVTYIVLAPEHSLVDKFKSQITNWGNIAKYRNKVSKKTEIERMSEGKEKTGVLLEGVTAINPANNEEIPVFIADYVLTHYGTGAIMAVPAHDERDFEFAKKYGLSIKEVVLPERIDKRNPPVSGKKNIERQNVHAIVCDIKNEKVLCLKWKKHPWITFPMGGVEEGESVIEAAMREVLEETGYKNLKNGKVLGGQVRAEYFAAHKDENRVAFTNAVWFELNGSEKEKVSQEESEQYEIFWMDWKEITTDKMTHAEMDIWLDRLDSKNEAYTNEGVLTNSGKFNGMNNEKAKKEITKFVGGKITKTYRLQDWVFSRQRYWGEPIPLIHCEKCGVAPVPEKDLPVELPKVKNYEPTGTGESPLASISKWVNVKCPKCGGEGKRETNTMPQWAGSSWYYLRYIDPKNSKALVDKKKDKYWSPVDMYVGGAEHATRHLIYARFWHKFLYDIKAVNYSEPFKRLQHVGLIIAEDGRKMSKRYGNVINPDDIVSAYGADTLRVYEMFMGPFDQSISWSTDNIIGSRRFLERIWNINSKVKNKISKTQTKNLKLENLIHKTIKKVSEDIEEFKFNTSISSIMILVNEMEKQGEILKSDYKILLEILAPFAPHITEELWAELGYKKSVHLEDWPKYDERKLKEETVKFAVQVNGKIRGDFEIQFNSKEDIIKEKALSLAGVQKWTKMGKIKKIIIVPNKLVSIVVA